MAQDDATENIDSLSEAEREDRIKRFEAAIAKSLSDQYAEAMEADSSLRGDRPKYRRAYEMKSERKAEAPRSDVVVPLTTSAVESYCSTAFAALMPHEEFFGTRPGVNANDEQASSGRYAQMHNNRKMRFRRRFLDTLRRAAIDGTAVWRATYNLKYRRIRIPVFGQSGEITHYEQDFAEESNHPDYRLMDNDRFHVSDITEPDLDKQDWIFESGIVSIADVLLAAKGESGEAFTDLYIAESAQELAESHGRALQKGSPPAESSTPGNGEARQAEEHDIYREKVTKVEAWGRLDLARFLEAANIPKEDRTDFMIDLFESRWGVQGTQCEGCRGSGVISLGEAPTGEMLFNPETGERAPMMTPVEGQCPACKGRGQTYEWAFDSEFWVVEFAVEEEGKGLVGGVLRCSPSTFPKGRRPYFSTIWLPRPHNSFWGMGQVEAGYTLQLAANAKENQALDLATMHLEAMAVVDRDGLDPDFVRDNEYDLDKILTWEPHKVIFARPGSVGFLAPPSGMDAGILATERMARWHEKATGASDTSQGISPKGRQTASEIETLQRNHLLGQFGSRETIAVDLIEPFFEFCHLSIQRFWQDDRMVHVAGKDGIGFKRRISRRDLQGDISFYVDIGGNRQVSALATHQMSTTVAVLAATPAAQSLNWPEIAQRMFSGQGIPNPSTLVLNPLRAVIEGDDDPNAENRLMLEFEEPVSVGEGENDEAHLVTHMRDLMQAIAKTGQDGAAQDEAALGAELQVVGQALENDVDYPFQETGKQLLYDHIRTTYRLHKRKAQMMAQQMEMMQVAAGGDNGNGAGKGPKAIEGPRETTGDLERDVQRTKQETA